MFCLYVTLCFVTVKRLILGFQECFNCPYGNQHFGPYAEPAPGGATSKMLAEVSKECGIYVVGGSIPEREGDRLFNTCLIYGPDGTLVGKHRKIHLFDIDVPGKMTFKESDTLTAGQTPTMFDTGMHISLFATRCI